MRSLLCCLWVTILWTGVAMAQDKMLEPYTGTDAISPFQQEQPQEGLPLDDQFVDAVTRAACAGDVDIDGAGTVSWTYTFNTLWHDRRTTSIYLASEFNCSDGGQINGIKYYVSTAAGVAMSDLTIRLRHTTLSNYSSPYCFDNTGWTICYEADTPILPVGWYTFNFTTPFLYNGVDNLEVDVSFNNSSYSGQGTIYAFTSSATRTIYGYCDSCNGDPKLWTCGSPNPTVNSSTNVPRARFIFPGGEPTGACCLPDGTCLTGLTQSECAAQGGIWQGEGTTCTPNNCPQPEVRCCLPDGGCLMLTAVDCMAIGGVPGAYGTDCSPIASYVATECTSPFEDISGTGTHVAGAEVDDGGASVPIGFTFNFFGVPKTDVGVTSNGYLTFGTVYGDYSPDPIPSTSTPNDLIAVLWRDLNASGQSVQYQTFGVAPDRWFIAQWTNVPCYSGCGPNTFQAVLYEGDGCIEFRYLLLDPAVSGYQAGVENSTGTIGVGVTGLVATGACIRLCPADVPPCPQPGACCFLDGSCMIVTQAACDALYGAFKGEGTTCDPNPCPPPCVECPPEGIPEGEPDCGPDYADNYNGGCNSSPNVFQPIVCGATICGEGGTYLFGGTQRRDTDWYQVDTTEPTTFTWTVTATFPALVGLIEQIVPGVPGCDNITGYVNPSFTTVACQPGGVTTVCLPAGTYYFFVATSAFAGVACGSPYVATLTCDPCATGACCQGDGQCLPDYNQPDCAAAGGIWQGAGTVCDPNPCVGACCFLDGACEVLPQTVCTDGGGTYLGGGTSCDLDPCPQPGPDTCDIAKLVSVPGNIYEHNRLATDDNPPYCGTSAPYKNVWYKVIGTGNTITASTCSLSTNFDTKIQVFCDCPPVTCVAGNDDSCNLSGHSLNSTVSFCTVAGVTHYITVGSYSSTTVGDFELIVTDDGVPCTGAICVPMGACCYPDGSCTMTPEEQCTSGIWLGEGSSCIYCEPCVFCGPGPHFIDTCAGGDDYLPSSALVGIDTTLDCLADTNLVMFGPVKVHRSDPLDDSLNFPGTRPVDGHLDVIDTEIVSMHLTGGGVVLTAGAGHGQGGVLAASLGNMAELPTDPALAESFFDVFFEVDLGGGNYVYNQTPLRVQTPVTCIPPFQDYIHVQDCVELWTSPTPGEGTHVANLVAPIHDAYPYGACCFPDGSCQTTTTEQVCLESGGVYLGVGTTCRPDNPCPQPPAACCYPDGTCAVTLQTDCTGVWHPEWPNCDVAQCLPPTGACCLPGSICQLVTVEQCQAEGGTFKGVGTTCDPNPCICRGDVNCDGVVDFGDINPFVLILSNFPAWQQHYPGCPAENGDIDGNGSVGFEDINPFVALIVQSPFPCQY
jgi:hypothetical protein